MKGMLFLLTIVTSLILYGQQTNSTMPYNKVSSDLTIYPVNDAYVGMGAWLNPDQNYGSQLDLFIGKESQNPTAYYKFYIHFNLSSIPNGVTISKATLKLQYNGGINGSDPSTNIYRVVEQWSENTITWNNAPAYYPSVILNYRAGELKINGYDEINLTSLVNDWYDGTSDNYGLLFATDFTEQKRADYTSNDHHHPLAKPRLIIEYEEVLAITTTQPNNNQTITQSDNVNINWVAAGPSGSLVSLKYDLDQVFDNGNETSIVLNRPLSDSYSWNTDGVDVGTYYIVGIVTDDSNYEYDYASGKITIEEPPPIIEMSLYRISDTEGTENSNLPGNEKSIFLPGETVRVTFSANNTGNDADVQTILNIRGTDNSTWVYDSNNSGENSSYDSPLVNGETDYYSFDWTIPDNATVGSYSIGGALRDLNDFNTLYETTSPGSNSGFNGNGWILPNEFEIEEAIPNDSSPPKIEVWRLYQSGDKTFRVVIKVTDEGSGVDNNSVKLKYKKIPNGLKEYTSDFNEYSNYTGFYEAVADPIIGFDNGQEVIWKIEATDNKGNVSEYPKDLGYIGTNDVDAEFSNWCGRIVVHDLEHLKQGESFHYDYSKSPSGAFSFKMEGDDLKFYNNTAIWYSLKVKDESNNVISPLDGYWFFDYMPNPKSGLLPLDLMSFFSDNSVTLKNAIDYNELNIEIDRKSYPAIIKNCYDMIAIALKPKLDIGGDKWFEAIDEIENIINTQNYLKLLVDQTKDNLTKEALKTILDQKETIIAEISKRQASKWVSAGLYNKNYDDALEAATKNVSKLVTGAWAVITGINNRLQFLIDVFMFPEDFESFRLIKETPFIFDETSIPGNIQATSSNKIFVDEISDNTFKVIIPSGKQQPVFKLYASVDIYDYDGNLIEKTYIPDYNYQDEGGLNIQFTGLAGNEKQGVSFNPANYNSSIGFKLINYSFNTSSTGHKYKSSFRPYYMDITLYQNGLPGIFVNPFEPDIEISTGKIPFRFYDRVVPNKPEILMESRNNSPLYLGLVINNKIDIDIEYYNIYRKLYNETDYKLLDDKLQNNGKESILFFDQFDEPQTEVKYKIKAIDISGNESEFSDEIVFSLESLVTVQAEVFPNNSGTITGAGSYDLGSSVTLTATKNNNWNFLNWTIDGNIVSTDNPYYFTVTESINIVANFEQSSNLHPTQFTLTSPTNNSTTTISPTYNWQEATDPEGKGIKYELWLSENSGFSTVTKFEDLATNSYQITSALNAHTKYYWKVKAIDGDGYFTWCNELDWWFTTPNNSPVLAWVGINEYQSDGLNPETGNTTTPFIFKVKYSDADEDAPLDGYPKVHILKGGNAISGSPFVMTLDNGGGNSAILDPEMGEAKQKKKQSLSIITSSPKQKDNKILSFTEGEIYSYEVSILVEGNDYTYYFEATDINNADATGEPTQLKTGPVVSTQPNVGLVAYYPFTGNAADSSGNGNDGTEYGGVSFVTDRFGKDNSALDLDGNDDYVQTPINTGITDKASFCAWIKSSTTNDISGIITSRLSNSFSGIYSYTNGEIYYNYQYSGGVSSSKNYIDGTWHFIVGVSEGDSNHLYIDGEKVISNLQNGNIDLSNKYLIGFDEIYDNRHFKGIIDDARIYNTALSQFEIDSLYHLNGWPSLNRNILIAYYPFTGNADDSSGNGNNGTINGALLTTDRFGNANSAYDFDGIDDFLEIAPLGDTIKTLSFWINFDIGGVTKYILTSSRSLGGSVINWQPDNTIDIRLGNGGYDFDCFGTVSTAQWIHVVAVNDGSELRTYLNGVLFGKVSGGNTNTAETLYWMKHPTPGFNVDGKLDDIKIYNFAITETEINSLYHEGGWGINSQPSTPQNLTSTPGDQQITLTWSPSTESDLDKYNIYKTTDTTSGFILLASVNKPDTSYIHSSLQNGITYYYKITAVDSAGNESEFSDVVNGTPSSGLVAYYPFTGNANDSSGNGNNGTVNGATLTADRFGNANSAYSFDGVNDEISCSVNSTLASFANSAHTVSLWVKMNSTANVFKFLVDYGGNNRDQEGIRINSSNIPQFKWVTDPAVSANIYANNNLILEQWYHIVSVVDGLTGKIYINGLLHDSLNVTSLPNANLFNSLKIGNISGGGTGDGFFNGTIDDISMYNYALNQNSIDSLYHVGNWPFTTLTEIEGSFPVLQRGANTSNGLFAINNMDSLVFANDNGDVRFLHQVGLQGILSIDNYDNGFLFSLGSPYSPWNGDRRVVIVDTTTWEVTDLIRGFNGPTSVKIATEGFSGYGGNIFVCESGNANVSSADGSYAKGIVMYDVSTSGVSQFYDANTSSLGIGCFKDMTFAPSNFGNYGNMMFVLDENKSWPNYDKHRILIIHPDKTAEEFINLHNLGEYDFVNSIDFSLDGEYLYVATNTSIYKIDANGNSEEVASGYQAINEIELDNNGNLFFYDAGLRKLFVLKSGNDADLSPAVPSNFVVTAGNEKVTLSWSANSESDLAGYNIYFTTDITSSFTKLVTVNAPDTSYVHSGLTNGTTYYYKISAVDNEGNESGFSNVVVVLLPYTLQLTSNPQTGGAITGGGTYNDNSSVIITAIPNSGWKFINWTSGVSIISTDNPYTLNITQDTALVANFNIDSCEPSNWTPVIYTNTTTAYGKVAIDNIIAEDGDIVGAFVNNECRAIGTVGVVDNVAYVTLVIQGEQPESVSFKVLDVSKCKILNVNYTIQTNPGNTIGLPPNYLPIDATSNIEQHIQLNEGWNLVSLNVAPNDNTPKAIFLSIIDLLTEVKEVASSYNPNVPIFLNTLKNISDSLGYWVKVTQDTVITVEGLPIDYATLQIQLNAGWSLIGYPLQKENNIENAVSSFVNEIIEVKNTKASFNPSVPPFLNTLKKMQPNEGYWIKVKTDLSFTYPTPILAKTKSATENNVAVYNEWQPVYYTNSMVYYTEVEIDNEPIESGFVGAFINNECRGLGTIITEEEKSYSTIVVNGEEAADIEFRIVTEDEIVTINEMYEFTPNKTNTQLILLKGNSEAYLKSLVPTTTKLYYAYPNPFNPSTQLKFDLHKDSNVKISIYNIQGELVKLVVNNKYKAGTYNITWNGTNNFNRKVSSGIYIVNFRTDSKSLSNKIILVK